MLQNFRRACRGAGNRSKVLDDFSLATTEYQLLAVMACVIAGFVRGFSGFGGPAVFLLILSQFFSPASLVPRIMLIDVAANSYLVPSSYRAAQWRVVTPIVLASLVTLPLGVYAMSALDPLLLKRAIAAITALSTLLLLAGWRMRRRPPLPALVALGLATGVVAGATYLVLHMVVFLLATPDSADSSRANFIVATFFMALVLIVTHSVLGAVDWSQILPTLGLALVYTLAAGAGTWLFRRTGEQRYRRLVLWMLVALSILTLV